MVARARTALGLARRPAPRRRRRGLCRRAARQLPPTSRNLGGGAVGRRCRTRARGRRPDPVRQPVTAHRAAPAAASTGRGSRSRRASSAARFLAGGISPANVRAASRGRRLCARRRLGGRGRARHARIDSQDRAPCSTALRVPLSRREVDMLMRGRFGDLRRRLCARNPDARARAARSGVRRGAGRSRLPGRARTSCSTKYAGRPTPLTLCRNLGSAQARIYLKREDLLHGGAHKTNQVLGQALLAKRMGKTRLIAETGAGQHGVATAIAGALFGLRDADLHGRATMSSGRSSTSSGCS